jgi:hypothetical protein
MPALEALGGSGSRSRQDDAGDDFEMRTQASGRVCLWCGNDFTPRCDGGKPQVFCRPICRRNFDAAGRRWVAEAIATGTLTVEELKNHSAATRALVPATRSPASVGDEVPPQPPSPVTPRAESCFTPQQNLERLMAEAIAMRRR